LELGPFLYRSVTPYGNRRQFPYGDSGSETHGSSNRDRGLQTAVAVYKRRSFANRV
jgi:hypothetical protein